VKIYMNIRTSINTFKILPDNVYIVVVPIPDILAIRLSWVENKEEEP
jgi:hypothetical protein